MSYLPLRIDKDVPLPRANRSWMYNWDAMQPGDSILISHVDSNAARSVAWGAAKRYGWRMATRKERGGTRIYRIE